MHGAASLCSGHDLGPEQVTRAQGGGNRKTAPTPGWQEWWSHMAEGLATGVRGWVGCLHDLLQV